MNRAHTKTRGFTIVELAVVIAVIALLATVSVVGYSAWQRDIAKDVLKSDLTTAATQLKNDLNWNDAYPETEQLANGGKGLPKSKGTSYTYSRTAINRYCLIATSDQEGVPTLVVSSDDTTPREGECPAPYIQTITTTNCPTERTMAVDARDNHTYYIQKLGEGANARCWMLTNLAYAGGGTNTYNDTIPTGDGSNGTLHGPDNSGSTTYTLAKYYIPTGANPTTNPTQPSTSTDGGVTNPQYGYLYNWCAAMGAQNGGPKPNTSACANATTPAPNTTISICPANWRLPTGQATTGDFTLLNNAVNSGLTNTDAGLRSEWLAQRSGGWYSGFSGRGSYGYYWSSAQYSAANGRYLNFSSSSVYPSSYDYKIYGFAVRCVAA
jgi:uncharacterized protein (TIGR02145 family)/prepilin-type N-terminal cleavage/methylation domain-containing protein